MSLFREYSRWQLSRQQLSLAQRGLNRKQCYEMRNILERWFLSTHNGIASDEKMISEVVEKGLHLSESATKLVNHLVELNKTSFPSYVTNQTVNVSEKSIVYNGFIKSLTPRIKYLLSKGSPTQVTTMLLRYESLLPGGQHWGIPWVLADYLYILGFRNEGFASPLNSRFIDKEDGKFCSLFADTDEPFGSLGSFFSIDLENYSGGWSINPPMINYFLIFFFEKIEKLLEENSREHYDFFLNECLGGYSYLSTI